MQRHPLESCSPDHHSPSNLPLPEDFVETVALVQRCRSSGNPEKRPANRNAFDARHLPESWVLAWKSPPAWRHCILHDCAFSDGLTSDLASEGRKPAPPGSLKIWTAALVESPQNKEVRCKCKKIFPIKISESPGSAPSSSKINAKGLRKSLHNNDLQRDRATPIAIGQD